MDGMESLRLLIMLLIMNIAQRETLAQETDASAGRSALTQTLVETQAPKSAVASPTSSVLPPSPPILYLLLLLFIQCLKVLLMYCLMDCLKSCLEVM